MNIYKIIELVILFILLPLMLLLNPLHWINLILIVSGFVYCIFILIKKESSKISVQFKFQRTHYLKVILLRFFAAALFSSVLMYILDKQALFSIVREKPGLWIMMSLIYSLFSVLPQEILYRTFFFTRYKDMFPGRKNYILLVNAVLFSFAHIFFRNILVLILTFAGGLLFSITYSKTRSVLLSSIEHALYGFWIFTLGLGGILTFPGV